jgi:cytochrome d ubiquinol oxidase subunit II
MATTWFIFITVCLLAYVCLDGYDLGIGTITLFERDRHRRNEQVELVANVWDGNETWLVLLAVTFWAGFPQAFGTVLPHMYLVLTLVLFSLIWRGASVEMISQAEGKAAEGWYRAFGIGSLLAGFAQGFALGALTSSIVLDRDGAFAGGAFDSVTWFSVLTGLTVTFLYLALGYAYLKSRGVGERSSVTRRGTAASLLAAAGGTATLLALSTTHAPLNLSTVARGISFWILLGFAAFGIVLTLVTMRFDSDTPAARHCPYLGLVLATAAVFVAVLVSHYPLIIPPSLQIDDSAAPDGTMLFLFIGIGFNIPLLAYYTWFAQRKLAGPVRPSATTTATSHEENHHV